jgi:hypothetical protein
MDDEQHIQNCSIEYSEDEYNPYSDKYGRTYTGHWKIPLEEEILKTNVTNMLNLKFNTTIHYIGTHLHPFAKSLELWDITTDSLLYRANVVNHQNSIGINHIDYYSSVTGIPVFKSHQYELVSTYHCTDSVEEHSAMATMFLYLQDRE